MSPLSNKEYAEEVWGICDGAKPEFPVAYHDPDGDCIEVLVEPGAFYSERIDDLITVYYSEATGKIIGFLIKGIERILKADPKTQIVVQAGRIRVSDFVLVGFLTQETADMHVYQKLRECVEPYHLETALCGYSSN